MSSRQPKSARHWGTIGALLAAAAVLLGAYGAHGLTGHLQRLGYDADAAAERVARRWEPAVRYQMAHALGLVLVGLLAERRPPRGFYFAGWLFIAGIGLFSGLLYIITFTGDAWRWLGVIVPLGGLALVAGWIAVALAWYWGAD